jgi:predicted transcriptional regulator
VHRLPQNRKEPELLRACVPMRRSVPTLSPPHTMPDMPARNKFDPREGRQGMRGKTKLNYRSLWLLGFIKRRGGAVTQLVKLPSNAPSGVTASNLAGLVKAGCVSESANGIYRITEKGIALAPSHKENTDE